MQRQRRGFWYGLAITVVRPLLVLLTQHAWRGAEHVPPPGTGVIVAANHLSHADPLTLAHFLIFGGPGRLPRFLAKSKLFEIVGLGALMRGAGQIPVYRGTADASKALEAAVAALQRGECVLVYPEGTTTKEPGYWLKDAKTGVARLALLSGAPVVPVAHWGTQRIFGQDRRLHLLPRHSIQVFAGPPVDLSSYAEQPLTVPVLRGATEQIMSAVREQLEELRGECTPTDQLRRSA